jgi:hypothetical protein
MAEVTKSPIRLLSAVTTTESFVNRIKLGSELGCLSHPFTAYPCKSLVCTASTFAKENYQLLLTDEINAAPSCTPP